MTIAEIRVLASQLSTQEKAQLISELAADLAKTAPPTTAPRRSLRGIWSGWGTGLTAEDIDEARHEM